MLVMNLMLVLMSQATPTFGVATEGKSVSYENEREPTVIFDSEAAAISEEFVSSSALAPSAPILQGPELPTTFDIQGVDSGPVRVAITLKDTPFDFSAIATAKDSATRQAIISRRMAQIGRTQGAIRERLANAGGYQFESTWLANVLYVTIPRQALSVLNAPGVVKVETLHQTPEDLAYSGQSIRDATLASELINLGVGGGDVRVAVVESIGQDEAWIASSHPAFARSDGSPRVEVRDCRQSTCALVAQDTTIEAHGTGVTWALAGAIDSGQDPDITNVSERQKRTSTAPDAPVTFIGISSMASVVYALQHAVSNQIELVNMSFGQSTSCDAGYDVGGLNAAIMHALESGVLIVVAAGNSGGILSGCSVTYPAYRPHVLAVGGADTGNFTSEDPGSYGSRPAMDISSKGPVHGRYNWADWWGMDFASVGVLAPGWISHTATGSTDPAGYRLQPLGGTSFAAPIVAGGAALLRSVLKSRGQWAGAKYFLNHLLISGDSVAADGVTETVSGVDKKSGYGHFRVLDPAGLTSPAIWTQTRFTFLAGSGLVQLHVGDSGRESVSSTQWKWSVVAFPENLNDVGIRFQLQV